MRKICIKNHPITDIDALRRRHAGNYSPLENGEVFQLPYEKELEKKEEQFFNSLSDYHFLKGIDDGLTPKDLRRELEHLDNGDTHNSFWKNFTSSALNIHLKKIFTPNGWRTYLRKANETRAQKPHHEDMLKCLYLLAHLHVASPSFLRQLATFEDVWSTDFRVYYPRNDLYDCEAYGAFLSELYSNILFHQPTGIRKLIKSLDQVIDKLVEHAAQSPIQDILSKTSADTDSPSLKILKYSQIASTSHFAALHKSICDNIDGNYSPKSAIALETWLQKRSGAQVVASANDYKLVAAQYVRLHIGRPVRYVSEKHRELCDLIYNVLAADAIRNVSIKSQGTRGGRRDTSLPAAIKKLAKQNPQSIEEILKSETLDPSSVPELHSKFLFLRTQYALFKHTEPGKEEEMVRQIRSVSHNFKKVMDYMFANNLDCILKDMELLHFEFFNQKLFDYGLRQLPPRKK
ncbi:hypothetical protein [Marinobacterium rhizophilum]|uniref:hypothetical protein n=1 Tax=Marinobacterium rhizophilum TaxID=420402 RepID=UPI00036B619C|nr:hypothetical protein [Marinobacterium rhizophilum]